MVQLSRRKFLYATGVSAVGAIALKGCAGNPPAGNTGDSSPVATPAVNPGGGDSVETATVRLGYIPIFEAAPLIIAQEKGFFTKYGMIGVQVLKQASWGSVREIW